MSVALCVVTYRRPRALGRCLRSIAGLQLGCAGVALRVVVVDNDAERSASPVVDAVEATCPWPVTYVVEPQRGIPYARNRALEEVAGAQLVGFVDDDEAVRPDWLEAMVREWRRTGADVLMGASVPRFVEPPPRWVEHGRFFDRERFTTGEPYPTDQTRTSGVLIATAALPVGGPVFDARFRYSGGSDSHLFQRMTDAGRRFVWVDDAVVEDWVPASRATAGWLIRRAFRIGNTRSLVLVAGGASLARRARRVAGSVPLIALLVWRALPEVRTGRAGVVRVAQGIANGAGVAAGAVGLRYGEYRRRIHGS